MNDEYRHEISLSLQKGELGIRLDELMSLASADRLPAEDYLEAMKIASGIISMLKDEISHLKGIIRDFEE